MSFINIIFIIVDNIPDSIRLIAEEGPFTTFYWILCDINLNNCGYCNLKKKCMIIYFMVSKAEEVSNVCCRRETFNCFYYFSSNKIFPSRVSMKEILFFSWKILYFPNDFVNSIALHWYDIMEINRRVSYS